MNENELSVTKYLEAITVMSNSIGKLDSLRVHLKENNDNMSMLVLEDIIKNLSKAIGNDYKMINIDNVTIAPKTAKTVDINAPKVHVAEIIEDDTIGENSYINMQVANNKRYNKTNTDFANFMKKSEDIIGKQKAKIEIDTNNETYTFVNSNTLDYAIYTPKNKEMIIQFKKNGRIYKYKNMPRFLFDNLVNIDTIGESAGAYFQREVVKKPKNYPYTEITDSEFIG